MLEGLDITAKENSEKTEVDGKPVGERSEGRTGLSLGHSSIGSEHQPSAKPCHISSKASNCSTVTCFVLVWSRPEVKIVAERKKIL